MNCRKFGTFFLASRTHHTVICLRDKRIICGHVYSKHNAVAWRLRTCLGRSFKLYLVLQWPAVSLSPPYRLVYLSGTRKQERLLSQSLHHMMLKTTLSLSSAGNVCGCGQSALATIFVVLGHPHAIWVFK